MAICGTILVGGIALGVGLVGALDLIGAEWIDGRKLVLLLLLPVPLPELSPILNGGGTFSLFNFLTFDKRLRSESSDA